MAPRIFRLCSAALAATSALSVAGCGSTSNSGVHPVGQADNGEAAKPGPQVMKDAVAAMTAAGAVHLTSVGTQGTPPQQVTMDGYVQSDGVMFSAKSAAGEADFIFIGKAMYTKSIGSGLALPGFPAKYANRWVKVTGYSSSDSGSSSSSVTFSSSTDGVTLAGLGKQLSDPDEGVTINGKVTRVTLYGRPAVQVTESDGSSFTVAASGKPYLLTAFKAASKNDGEGSATIRFSDYGKHVVIQAPADAVDLGALLQKNLDSLLPSTLPSGFPTAPPSN